MTILLIVIPIILMITYSIIYKLLKGRIEDIKNEAESEEDTHSTLIARIKPIKKSNHGTQTEELFYDKISKSLGASST